MILATVHTDAHRGAPADIGTPGSATSNGRVYAVATGDRATFPCGLTCKRSTAASRWRASGVPSTSFPTPSRGRLTVSFERAATQAQWTEISTELTEPARQAPSTAPTLYLRGRETPLVDYSHETWIENIAASRVHRISIAHSALNGNRAQRDRDDSKYGFGVRVKHGGPPAWAGATVCAH